MQVWPNNRKCATVAHIFDILCHSLLVRILLRDDVEKTLASRPAICRKSQSFQNDVPRSWLVTRRGCFRVDLYLFLQCCVNVFRSSGCRRSFRVTGAFSCPFLPELGPSGPKPISSSLWDWVTLLLSKEWEKDLLGQKYMNTTYQMGIKWKVNIKTDWRTKI